MIPKHAPILLIAFSLMAMACNLSLQIPRREVSPGPERVDAIEVALPEDTHRVTEVELAFGGGRLSLSPGAETHLISGTATYNVEEFKPAVSLEGGRVKISQEGWKQESIPHITGELKNEWKLQLSDVPVSLRILAGAYQGNFELGGLSVRRLEITDGAAETWLSFSEPNRVEMESFRYQTGASKVSLLHLANANFSDMIFKSGAGEYTLDFSGGLQRDASIAIESGLSNVILIVPPGTPAHLTIQGGLTDVKLSGAWTSSGSEYTTSGEGPMLTIRVQMGAGSLQLRDR